jgi:two-component system, chemotaxis family, chemotaxis protein CheY
MVKKIALVGHCGPDSTYLRMTVKKALGGDAAIVMADDDSELSRALGEGVDLILFNRELGYGFSQTHGVELIRHLTESKANVKMMLVSNHPDAQAAAVEAGAMPGFGKRELGTQRVVELLREAVK